MATRGEGYARLDGRDLVRLLPRPPRLSIVRATACLIILLGLSYPGYRLLYISLWWIGPVYLAAVGVIAGSNLYRWQPVVDQWHQRRWQRKRRRLLHWQAGAGKYTGASGVAVGNWIGSRDELADSRRALTRERKHEAQTTYELVVAAYQYHGTEYRFGLASGARRSHHPTARMLTHANPSLVRALSTEPREPEAAAAPLIAHVVSALASHPESPLSVQELVTWSSAGQDQQLLVLALDTAELWGLVTVNAAQPGRRGRLLALRLRGSRDEVLSASIHLSDAGLVWHQATGAMDAERQRRRRVTTGGRDESVNVHVHGGHVMAPIVAARGNATGNRLSAVSTVRLSDAEVIDAASQLLSSTALPWRQPDHARARIDIEQAVDRRDVHDPRLRAAMQYLLHNSGQIILGVVGNYATDGLKAFFG